MNKSIFLRTYTGYLKLGTLFSLSIKGLILNIASYFTDHENFVLTGRHIYTGRR